MPTEIYLSKRNVKSGHSCQYFESEEADVKKIMQISLKPSSEKKRETSKELFERQKDPKALKMLDEL